MSRQYIMICQSCGKAFNAYVQSARTYGQKIFPQGTNVFCPYCKSAKVKVKED